MGAFRGASGLGGAPQREVGGSCGGGVGERPPAGPQTGGLCGGQGYPARQPHEDEIRFVGQPRVDDRLRLPFVNRGRVVERSMRLEIPHPRASHPGEPVKGAELIDDVGGELRRGHVDGPPAEASKMVVAHVGADDDTSFSRCGARPFQSERIAGMELSLIHISEPTRPY